MAASEGIVLGLRDLSLYLYLHPYRQLYLNPDRMNDCIFCRIARREVPKEFTYEDEDIMVFPDINPVKPIHLLIIPKKHIPELHALDNPALFEKIGFVILRMIVKMELQNKGYRVVINGGGAQIVDHLHIHLMGPIAKTATL